MLKTPVRVLHMIAILEMGGSQSMVMNIYRAIDRKKLQFDFIVDHPDRSSELRKEIESLGGRVYSFPTFKGINIAQIRKAWDRFFTDHPEYKILHTHSRSYASVYLPIAKKHGLVTISHAHSTSNGNGILAFVKNAMQYPIRYQADYMFACSEEAGRWLFGDKAVQSDRFKVMPNAIDVQKFKYNEEIRNKMRKTITNKNEIIIGHVGRLTKLKNQSYLIHICELLRGKGIDYKMVFIGTGEDKDSLIQLVKKKHLEDSIIFKGSQDNVNEWMQAFDVFAFPSLYEGLGIVAIEAQTASLPTLCSENVPAEANISSNFIQVPLSNPGKWAEIISKIEPKSRIDTSQVALDAGYDIKSSALEFQEFYIRKVNGSN